MSRNLKEEFIFDFPMIPENAHIFESKIDWEAEEKALTEQKKAEKRVGKKKNWKK